MLLRWGTDVADEAKTLPCYLEASPVGQHLYQSTGFEHVETLDMDLSKWGGEGIHCHYVMVRPANGHLCRPSSVNWTSMFEEDALKCTDMLWRSRVHHHRAVD